MVDILCGILAGWGYGNMLGRPNYSHMVMAINIDHFSTYEVFVTLMQEYIADLQKAYART